MISESRLIGYNVKTINRQRVAAGAAPITSAANPTGQLTTRDVKANVVPSQSSANAPSPLMTQGERQTAEYSAYQSQLQDNPTKPFDSEEDGQKIAAEEYRLYGSVSPETEARLAVTQNPNLLQRTTSDAQQRQDQLSGALDLTDPNTLRNYNAINPRGIQNTSNLTPRTDAGVTESASDFQNRKAAIEQQNTQRMQQTQLKQQQKDQARQQGGTVGVSSATDSMMENLKLMASSNPDLAAFLPQIEALASQQNSQTAGAQGMYNEAMGDFASDDLNGDGVTDGVASAVSESKQILKGEKDQQDAINLENRDIATESAKLAKDMAQLEKDKFELNQLRNENLVREQNIEAELKNRRVANKLGINADTNGLKWMATEIRKGNEHLSYLEQSGDIQSAQFALQIGREYNLNIKSALNNYNAQQAQIDSVFRKELENLDSIVSMDAKERQKEKKEWNKWLFEQKAAIDLKTAERMDGMRKDMMTYEKELRDQETAKKKDARDSLQWLVGTYGSASDPNAIAEYTKILGEDPSWFKTATMAEIKQAQGEAITPQQSFQAQNDLRKEFTGASAYKDRDITVKAYDSISNAVAESNRIVEAMARGPQKNADGTVTAVTKESLLGSDINMMYSFIKMMDNNSAVREGELDLLEGGQSLKTWITEKVSKAERDGTTLTPEQRTSLLKQAETIRQYSDGKYQEHINNTAAMIEDANTRFGMGINPKSILGSDYYPGGAGAADAAMDDVDEPMSRDVPPEGSRIETPIITGTISGYGSKKWGAGLDIAAPKGAPVRTHLPGTVIKVVDDYRESFPNNDSKGRSQNGGFGNQVVVRYADGTEALFNHLDRTDVKALVGKPIPAGSLLGYVGNTGNTYGKTGVHLDLTLRRNGEYLSPQEVAQWMGASNSSLVASR